MDNLIRNVKALCTLLLMGLGLTVLADVSVKSVEANQRYPWNGLVDIVVTIEGSTDDVVNTECYFAASNCTNGSAVPVKSIVQNGSDVGSGSLWKRRFIWNAANDVGAVKIDDLALSVDAKVTDCVQLWENGPYWAKCNIGATRPEEYGYYFWWGGTVGCKRNANNDGWVSVKDGTEFSFVSDNCPTSGKDNSKLKSSGYINAAGNLVAMHDAATSHLGASWRIPTDADFSELIGNCTTVWEIRNGVYGRLVTGKGSYSSKSVFLPAAGYGYGSGLYYSGSLGYFYSASPNSSRSNFAWSLYLDSGTFRQYDLCGRSYGCSIRPLREFTEVEMALAGVTTRFKLDCRSGVRRLSYDGEFLCYDASWCEGGEEVRITDNGTIVATGTAGVCTWHPKTGASTLHLLRLEVLSQGQVIETETAQFALGYIRNMTAKQLWPHNKVALEFTVADDIGDVMRADEDLSVWCACGTMTSEATKILGDRSAKPGVHRIVWDMEADGLRFVNEEAAFWISIEAPPTDGVQLWENGPYWAECNVGAAEPEENGYYFWWGDTVGYKRNASKDGWESVRDGTSFSFDALNCPTHGKDVSQLQSEGYVDTEGSLLAEHDAAVAHCGMPWRMPTKEEFSELVRNCTIKWIIRNGVHGGLVTGKGAYSSKSIFLPASGYGIDSFLNGLGSDGRCWSSSPASDNPDLAWSLGYYSDGFSPYYYPNRYDGRSVRPLREIANAMEQTVMANVATTAVDMTLNDELIVSGSVNLACSPIDSGIVTLAVNGSEVLSTTEAMSFNWSPGTPGTYILTHRAGEHVFTRKVICLGADDTMKLEIGWLDRPVSNLFPKIYASVTNVVIAPSMSEIGPGAFDECSALKELSIPQTVTNICNSFNGCAALGAGVIIVDDCVLTVNGDCPNWVVLPESTRIIAESAFSGCANLSEIKIPKNVSSIGSLAFCDTSLTRVFMLGHPSVPQERRIYEHTPESLVTYVSPDWIGDSEAWQGREVQVLNVEMTPSGTTALCGTTKLVMQTMLQGGIIRYTLDGTEPTTASSEFTRALGISEVTTVKAAVEYGGTIVSDWTETRFVLGIVEHPVITAYDCEGQKIDSGEFYKEARVTISCGESGSQIYFSVNGGNYIEYKNEFKVHETTAIQAYAVKESYGDSEVVTNVLTRRWKQVATPIINTASHFDDTNGLFVVTCSTEGATIRYEFVDGLSSVEDPTEESLVYMNPVKTFKGGTLKARAFGTDPEIWLPSDVASAHTMKWTGIPTSLDAPELVFETGGDAKWVTDFVKSEYHAGWDSMHSGSVSAFQTSWIQTRLRGPGELSFWWMTDCEGPANGAWDHLALYVDNLDSAVMVRDGSNAWAKCCIQLGEGDHCVRWSYEKDGDAWGDGRDCGWIDHVIWMPEDGTGYTKAFPIPVEYQWLKKYGLLDEGAPNLIVGSCIGKTKADGSPMYVWEDYVAGTDPTNPESKFTSSIVFANGEPLVTWSPDLNEDGKKSVRKYTTYGCENIGGNWQDISTVPEADKSNYRFFKVTVGMP